MFFQDPEPHQKLGTQSMSPECLVVRTHLVANTSLNQVPIVPSAPDPKKFTQMRVGSGPRQCDAGRIELIPNRDKYIVGNPKFSILMRYYHCSEA